MGEPEVPIGQEAFGPYIHYSIVRFTFIFISLSCQRKSSSPPKEREGGKRGWGGVVGAGWLSLSSPHGGAGGANRSRGFWPLYTLLYSYIIQC